MLWILPVPIIHQKFFLAYANLILFFLPKITKLAIFLLTKNTRSRDQFLSYETETTTVRDQDQDQCKTAETKIETETTKVGLETETGLETDSPDAND